MKFVFLILLFFVSGCSDNLVESPDIKRVKDQETNNCSFHQDIEWELNHGVSASMLIEALNACKNPKFKRGQILLEKDNKNCTFQVYYANVLYPSRIKEDDKIEALYVGKENCNGLINDLHFTRQSNLLIKHKRK